MIYSYVQKNYVIFLIILKEVKMIKKFYNFYYVFINIILIECQIINRPPQFIPGSGDMSRFSLSENTTVGSSVYRLQGNKN